MAFVAPAWGQEETLGVNSRGRIPYLIVGTSDRALARSWLLSYVPSVLVTCVPPLYLQDVTLKERPGVVEGVWDAEAIYGPRKYPEPGEWQYEFDITAETQKITHSLETVAWYPPGDTAASARDFAGTIGARPPHEPEGCDIYFPKMKWTEMHQLPTSLVTWNYVEALRSVTAKTNNAIFRGRAANTVLFAGCNGRRSSKQSNWFDCTFTFWYDEDKSFPMTIQGSDYTIEKGAWDYFWAFYLPDTDATVKGIVTKPNAAYIEQVYQDADFGLLGIGVGAPTF